MQRNSPRISIVMPLYNKEADVRDAVASVLAQTNGDFELIVVDDGSTDSGPDIVKKMRDPRIVFVEQQNAGVSAARNRGILECRSEIVAFIDADDKWETTFLETIFKLLNKFPECSVFATGYAFLERDGLTEDPVVRGLPSPPWSGIMENYFQIASNSDPPIWTSAVAVKKAALESVGGFPAGISIGEDLLTWARLAVEHKIAYESRPHALYRRRSSRHDAPTRVPEYPDTVALSLSKLLENVVSSRQRALRGYIAWWHKNRANMNLRLQRRWHACKEVLQMGRYRPNGKFVLYVLMLGMPFWLVRKLLRFHGGR